MIRQSIRRTPLLYNDNGSIVGIVPTDSNLYSDFAIVTVSDNTGDLKKPGYTFAGWNTAKDGSGKSFPADATCEMGIANVTLYAQWKVSSARQDMNCPSM